MSERLRGRAGTEALLARADCTAVLRTVSAVNSS